MALRYKISDSHARLGSVQNALFAACLASWLILDLLGFFDIQRSNVFAYLVPCLFVFFLIVFYQFIKKAEVIFDNDGIRVSSGLLNWLPEFAPITFNDSMTVTKVTEINHKTTILLARLFNQKITKKTTIISLVIEKKILLLGSFKKQHIISKDKWQIDDFDELSDWFLDQGFTVKILNEKQSETKYLWQQAQMSKSADYCAYATIATLIMSFITAYFFYDWSTIYYGNFKYILWLVLFVVAIVAYFIMSRDKQAHAIIDGSVAILLSLSSTLLLLLLTLSAVPIIGKQSELTFEYQKRDYNHDKEEIWVATDNPQLQFRCKNSQAKDLAPQKVITVQFGSIIRINSKGLCAKSKFIHDGGLPHK